jgi:hypothetical protein
MPVRQETGVERWAEHRQLDTRKNGEKDSTWSVSVAGVQRARARHRAGHVPDTCRLDPWLSRATPLPSAGGGARNRPGVEVLAIVYRDRRRPRHMGTCPGIWRDMPRHMGDMPRHMGDMPRHMEGHAQAYGGTCPGIWRHMPEDMEDMEVQRGRAPTTSYRNRVPCRADPASGGVGACPVLLISGRWADAARARSWSTPG